MVTIKKANSEEINELLHIYIDKVKWLRSLNKPLWHESQFTFEELTKKYDNPIFYIGKIEHNIIGGFILVEYDHQYWPEKTDNDAYYFHKFVIKNEYCGNGISDEMISWVKKHGKENGKKYIRLDYDGNRKPITNLYIRNGFVPIETISNEHVDTLVKAEYKII
jgi:hypothetical protein